jgi:glycosyltransferase involved in cell wall biosynthesis
MNILAFLPCLNEADILPWTLDHMVRQGIRVHVIDGWSTDGSFEIARDFLPPWVTVERFPASGPSPLQSCREILAHIEELAWYSNAEWCYLSDADEIRRSPEIETTLHDMIVRVDASGYNAIDHRVYAFFPVDNGWQGEDGLYGIPPEEYFRHYNETDMICTIPQEKAWKNNIGGVRIDLVSSGGHQVQFPGKRVYPVKFVMKHYPFRNSAQALQKILTRLTRRDEREHRDGWGVHYDRYLTQPGGFTGLWAPGELSVWEDRTLAEPEE